MGGQAATRTSVAGQVVNEVRLNRANGKRLNVVEGLG